MDNQNELKNIALLIDADNTQPAAIDPVLTAMAELGQVNIRRAYGNFAKGNLSKWDTITNRYGIRPQQQFDVSKGKNATDMAMTTTRAICQAPEPIWEMSRPPIPTPNVTPPTSSTLRRRRFPMPIPSARAAAIGAKKGRWLPIRSWATYQARPAEMPHCRIGSRA